MFALSLGNLHRPQFLWSRLFRALRGQPPERGTVALPWGDKIEVRSDCSIGRDLWRDGIHDLPVSELLSRLVEKGAFVINVGADNGYLGCILGRRAGQNGRLDCFEPDPNRFRELQANLNRMANEQGFAQTSLHPLKPTSDGEGALDRIVGKRSVNLIKIDLECGPLEVLEAAKDAIHENRIDHIVFKPALGFNRPCVPFLESHGYTVFEIKGTKKALHLDPLGEFDSSEQSPTLLATLRPRLALCVSAKRGWTVLGSRLTRS